MQRKKFTQEEISKIIQLHKEGKSPTEIAPLFNTYNTSIRRILLRNGIKLKNQSEAQASVIKNPFEDYRTDEQSAYWLGYLIADGCVSVGKGGYRVIINTNKDPEHLQKYAGYINRPLQKYWNKTYEVWEYSVVFYNKNIVNWLIDIGITPKKSLTFEFKGEFNNHLLRGIFDGDGCVHKDGRICITTASKRFRDQCINFLNNQGFNLYVNFDRRNNSCWNVYINGQEKFYNFIYLKSTIKMQRKEQLLGQLIGNS